MRTFLALLLAFMSFQVVTPLSAQEPSSKPAKSPQVKELTLDEAEKLTQSNTNVIILDVRTRKEYAAGHLPKAKNLDFYAPDFEAQLKKMDKSKAVLVHCATGGRSSEAREKMKSLGFQQIYHMDDGFKGWSKAGKKVVQ